MKSRPFLIISAIIVAVIAAASAYIAQTIDRFDQIRTVIAAPDGKFKAVRVTITGGGEGDQRFCFDTVSVLLAVYPDDSVSRRKEYEIYNARCGTFADGSASPKIEWPSHAQLRITYTLPPGSKPARTRDHDVTNSVRIEFVEKK